ncbi:WhiB family transcriptional regulator [Mycobacterium sp. MUNTM1]
MRGKRPEGALISGWPELVGAILRGVPSLPGALCRQRPELFDSDDGETASRAVAICRRCPALQPCGAWAGALRHNEARGVLAGERREWVSHPSTIRKCGE